jgi:hypothetical protein
MPIYAIRCDCGHAEDFYAPVESRNDTPLHCKKPMKRVLTPPHVLEDMKPYISPLDGKPVKSRKDHVERMRRHGVVEVGNENMMKPARKNTEPVGVEQDVYDAMRQVNERT